MFRTNVSARIACIATATLTALSLSACSSPADLIHQVFDTPTIEEARATQTAATTAQLSSSALVSEGVLTVGIDSSSSAPMTITDSSGKFTGYDIDVASALADYLGLKVEFVSVSNLSSSVGTTCDIVMNTRSISATGLTIVGSYAEDATAFFYKGDAKVASVSDINSKTIGVQSNSTSEQYLKRSNLTVEEETYSNLNDAFEALESGDVDYVLCDALAGSYLAEVYSNINIAGTLDVPESIGVAAAASNSEIQTVVQEALAKLNTNGVIDIIRSKWINGLETLTTSSQVSGITISSTTVAGNSETTNVTDGTSGVQDGSNAGANAVDVEG